MGQFSHLLDLIDDSLEWGSELGLTLREAEDERLDGRTVRLDGRDRCQFFSCSYLGLELHPALRAGAIDAVERYGTQFSSSRTYISAPLYGDLEDLLGEITGGSCMVAPNTTLGSISTLPVIIGEDDAVLLDHQVHHTVQLVVPQLQSLGIPVSMIRHGDVNRLEDEIKTLRRRHKRIWYLADSIYSMYGDLAPWKTLSVLLDRYPELHLYLDDAHGMSWTGQRGRGAALEALGNHERLTVAVSLNKSFGAGGGAIVFPDAASCERVRRCGGPMIFTGPLQPPMLGAAVASAELHLTPELEVYQAELLERIQYVNRRAAELDLPLANRAEVPIRFLALGPRDAAAFMGKELLERGFLANCSSFPAVAAHLSGIRFTVTRHHTFEDLNALLGAMAELLPMALAESGTTRAALDRAFGLASTSDEASAPKASRNEGLACTHARSIAELDAAEWDGWMAGRGSFDADGCAAMEDLFGPDEKPENRCRFHYFVIREGDGRPVLATFFTESLMKDDMFAEPGVSKATEERRRDDPHYLTSRVLAMGCPLTEGDHLWLDRSRDWRGALQLLAMATGEIAEEADLDLVAMRDLPADDRELRDALEESGFHAMDLPLSMVAEVPVDRAAMLEGLSRRARRFQSDEVEPFLDAWRVDVLGAADFRADPGLCAHLYDLYHEVWTRSFHLNTFALPETFPRRLVDHPGWEILALSLREEQGRPRAFLAARQSGEAYVPLVVGLDYRSVGEHGAYRQCIHHALERARELGASRVLMGMGAELEKRRFGADPEQRKLFVRARDHYQADLLTLLSGDVHLRRED